jgi:two-component system invasion response regulator UvrY
MQKGQNVIRILIADDHELIRAGLKTLLAHESDLKVVAEAKNGHEVLEYVGKNTVDIILLDISMPEKSGFDVLGDLKKRGSRVPVLMLTMHPEKRYAPRAFKSGAAGYVTKTSASTELVAAIRTIISGKRYISPEYAEQVAHDFQNRLGGMLHEELSDREYQVFCLIASGDSIHDIAETLHIGEATVYTHRERILEKMHMKSVAELARYAVEQGLIE